MPAWRSLQPRPWRGPCVRWAEWECWALLQCPRTCCKLRSAINHQPAMVDARLHPADVITHDEEDVGLLLLLRGSLRRRRHHGGEHRQHTEVDSSDQMHNPFLQGWLSK